MALVWHKCIGLTKYKVTRAGNAIRLYRNKVLHSQWNPSKPISGNLWDLFLMSSIDANTPINNVLVLGAGGGAIINLVHHFFPKCNVVAIDLDETHLYVARKYFKVSKKYCTLIHSDAKDWLKLNQNNKYDLIIDDVFIESDNVPYRSIQFQALWMKDLLLRLSKHGVLVINFADKKEWLRSKKQLAKMKLIDKYQFAVATHYACDNQVVHVSKKLFLSKNIKENLIYKSGRQYKRYIENGTIEYKKLAQW
ncbi:MAG: class I SAM-dependent methyltransferase [Gammaproteobacteria bacterium]|nr:class I SAM-dependent methyltransferase [Gammaproteobacteria bacterium]